MNIYAKEGDKVIYLDKNGYDHDKEIARKHLKAGEEYTVQETNVENWETSVYLQEFPKIGFNSVMFADKGTNG